MSITAESLISQGYQARREHRSTEAKAAFTKAVAITRANNNTALLAESLKGLGQIERDEGETDEALEHYQQATALIRSLNDPLNLAHTVRHLADILRESGHPESAAPYYDEALILYRRHPNAPHLDLANALRGIALNKSDLGDKQAAIQLWQEAGALYQQVNVPAGVAESQRQIAQLSAP